MWTTVLQMGELIETALTTFDRSETRIFVSHMSPGREGLLAQLALALRVFPSRPFPLPLFLSIVCGPLFTFCCLMLMIGRLYRFCRFTFQIRYILQRLFCQSKLGSLPQSSCCISYLFHRCMGYSETRSPSHCPTSTEKTHRQCSSDYRDGDDWRTWCYR